MSAERLVKRLPVPWRGLPIGGALALALSARPRSPPIHSRPTGRSRRSLRRASSQAATISPGSRLLSRQARSPIGAIPATLAFPPPWTFRLPTMSRASSLSFRRRNASWRPTAARHSATTAMSSFPCGQAARPGEARDTQAQRRFRRVRESLPAGQSASRAQAYAGYGLASCGGDRGRPSSCAARRSAEGFRRARGARRRRAGACCSAHRKARGATCSSRRRRVGG